MGRAEPDSNLSMGSEQQGGSRGTLGTHTSTSGGTQGPGRTRVAVLLFVLLRKVLAVSYWSSPLECR